jgi:hypothetical protein
MEAANLQREQPDECNGIAVYDRHQQAEEAIQRLSAGGFDVKKLSIIGREPHVEERAVGFDDAAHRARRWGKWGAFWGGLVGIVFGPIFLWIPGIGFVIVGGLLTSFILGTVEGAAVGAAAGGGGSALVGALTRMGIPKESVILYEKSIQADKFVVIAHGTRSEVERERALLEKAGLGPVRLHALAA